MKKTIATILAALVVVPTALAGRTPSPTKVNPDRVKVHTILAKKIECSDLEDTAIATGKRDDLRRAARCDRQLADLILRLYPPHRAFPRP